MAILLERLDGHIARVYAEVNPAPMADFIATFAIEWDKVDPRALWIKALNGKMRRANLRELLTLMVSLGVHTIRAKRADGHVLPFGRVGPDGTIFISMAMLVERFAAPGASEWAELGDG